jgi:predicted dithiol-disulfide oxidoreductase (DUF899 family)
MQARIVSKDEWTAARKALLAKERRFNRQRDALSAERRALPMVEIEKKYELQGREGRAPLAELFGGKRQLLVYHFMFGPEDDEGCPACSLVADNFASGSSHLARTRHRVRRGLARRRSRRSSASGSAWAGPFRGSRRSAAISTTTSASRWTRSMPSYNYAPAPRSRRVSARRRKRGLERVPARGRRLFHTYSTYQRGLDPFLNTYNFLDLTPLGRQEEEGIMRWVRHHDRY